MTHLRERPRLRLHALRVIAGSVVQSLERDSHPRERVLGFVHDADAACGQPAADAVAAVDDLPDHKGIARSLVFSLPHAPHH